MDGWHIKYISDANKDLLLLDNSQRMIVLKAVRKVSQNPLPKTEGGLGIPLGHLGTSNLTNFCEIKLRKLGIRVIYKLVIEQNIMKVIVISIREDEMVYKIAVDRTDE